jgi:NAD(P)-dependent dehydrogenase (short-subunit alcohol dehydrogenase family)
MRSEGQIVGRCGLQRAIVTGGTRGIGLAIAKAIVTAGGAVMVTGRQLESVDAVVRSLAELAGDPARVSGAAVDARDSVGANQLVAETVRRFGGLDVLVNNAGIGAFTDVASMSDSDWDSTIGTNLSGVFYCSRAAIPAMRQSGGGWIINMASLAGRNYFPRGAAYCASKAGLVAFSECLMQEVRYDNIRVSVIMPGSVATEFDPSTAGSDDSWKLAADDVAQVVADLLKHPARSLPSRIEIRPAQPRK